MSYVLSLQLLSSMSSRKTSFFSLVTITSRIFPMKLVPKQDFVNLPDECGVFENMWTVPETVAFTTYKVKVRAVSKTI